MIMRLLMLLLAAVMWLSACGGGQNATSAGTADHDVATVRSQNVLNEAIEAGAPGCSAAVGVNGKVVWTGVRGVADTATGNAITTQTVFDIASVSKQFTATALLLLVDAGKLTHQTSGVPEYVGLLEAQGFQLSDRTTEDQALQTLVSVPKLEFQPGSRFEYSNSNYLLLGEIVRRISREPLAQFLTEKLFHPLSLAMVLDPTGQIPNKAIPYEKGSDGYRATQSGWEQVGDGGIQTTPSQLISWADNYRTGRVGGPKLLGAQRAGAVQTEPGGGDRYGAGIYSLANGMLDHDGAWGGFVTAFRVSKDRTTSLAISCNTDKQDPEALADSLGKLWM